MTCDQAEILLHALLDGELDAGHAREVELHMAACAHCAALLQAYGQIRDQMAHSNLRFATPPLLRQRVETSLPPARAPNRRGVLKGFALGSALSALAATGLVVLVRHQEDEQRILSDVVSAHLRSLQAGHLTDVLSTDQHTVKPWFNGRLDVAPPVIDLAAQGFTLIGRRLDYIDGRTVGVIVYRRRIHVINLFVAQTSNTDTYPAKLETVQGFNIRHWSQRGLSYWAASDLNSEELADFGSKFEHAVNTS